MPYFVDDRIFDKRDHEIANLYTYTALHQLNGRSIVSDINFVVEFQTARDKEHSKKVRFLDLLYSQHI